MSDSAAPTAPPAVVQQVHQAIRRGSVLKAVAKPSEGGLSSEAINAYNQSVTTGKNEASLLAELSEKGGNVTQLLKKSDSQSVELKNAQILKEIYLAEQANEAEILTANSQILRELRAKEEEDATVPPPPPAEEDSSSLPPPPSSAPPADFMHELSNPKLKLNLAPIHNSKLIHDGVNPNLATLAAIESKKNNLSANLKSTETQEKNFFNSTVFKGQYAAEEIALNNSLRRNSMLLDQLKLNAPPPAYPYSQEDLDEAAQARKNEQELLVKTPAPEEVAAAASPSSSSAAPIERVRRNSKLAFLGDVTKPLLRVGLTPVITEEKTAKERYEQEKAGEAAEGGGGSAQ